MKDMREVMEIIDKQIPELKNSPLQKLSEDRAAEVLRTVVDFAKAKGYQIDESQIRSQGVGPLEPASMMYYELNRRVEFRIIRPDVETPSDFNYY